MVLSWKSLTQSSGRFLSLSVSFIGRLDNREIMTSPFLAEAKDGFNTMDNGYPTAK